MTSPKDINREKYHNTLLLWVALAPVGIILGLFAAVAWVRPEMFGL